MVITSNLNISNISSSILIFNLSIKLYIRSYVLNLFLTIHNRLISFVSFKKNLKSNIPYYVLIKHNSVTQKSCQNVVNFENKRIEEKNMVNRFHRRILTLRQMMITLPNKGIKSATTKKPGLRNHHR